jgi:hypothetical protein
MRSGLLVPPDSNDKDGVRKLHNQAVEHYVKKSRRGLQRHEKRLLSYIASGGEVHPEHLYPRLVEVRPDSEAELLFRYVRLHWSIPVSAGYGRRLCFLIPDESNGQANGSIRTWRSSIQPRAARSMGGVDPATETVSPTIRHGCFRTWRCATILSSSL